MKSKKLNQTQKLVIIAIGAFEELAEKGYIEGFEHFKLQKSGRRCLREIEKSGFTYTQEEISDVATHLLSMNDENGCAVNIVYPEFLKRFSSN